MKKLIAFIALLNLTGIVLAHPHGGDELPTASTSREVAVNSLIAKLQVRVQSHAFDGDFETGYIFPDGISDDVKEVIQNTFLKAGYKVVWAFDEKTKELRLTISWR